LLNSDNKLRAIRVLSPITIVSNGSTHYSIGLDSAVINSRSYTKSESDVMINSVLNTGAISKSFKSNANEDVMIFNNTKDVEIKGNMFITKDFSILGNSFISGDLQIINNKKIITSEISTKLLIVDSSGVIFKNTSSSDILKVFNSGTVLHSNDMIIRGNITIDGEATLNGKINSMYWVAAHCSSNGTVQIQKGIHNLVVSKNVSDTAYGITFPAHPDGANYIVMISSTEFHSCYRFLTSTSFTVYLRNVNSAGGSPNGSGEFDILVLK